MATKSLSTYLNDHFAGSQAAIDLLEHLERSQTPRLASFAGNLRAEIEADRQALKDVMRRCGVATSRTRAAVGWLTEKAVRFKLAFDDWSAGPSYLLEAFEFLSLGIEGKRLLWEALAAASGNNPELRGTHYARLRERAEDQRRRVEQERQEAAKGAFVQNAPHSEVAV